MTSIIAHAGCEGSAPNSLAYVQTALAAGVDAIELDLRLCGEQVLLSHDPLEEDKRGQYLTLEDAAVLARDAGVGLNCDLKEKSVFIPARRVLQRVGMEKRTFFTGQYPASAAPENSGCRYYFNTDHTGLVDEGKPVTAEQARALSELFRSSRDPALCGLNIDYLTLTHESMEIFRSMHVPLCCWTVDDEQMIQYLLEQQVECITTNLVKSAVRLRDARRS